MTDECPEPIGPAERAGYSLDLPPGEHPYDWFIGFLASALGLQKAAAYLGVYEEEEDEG